MRRPNVRIGTAWHIFSFAFRGKPAKQDRVKLDFFLGADTGKVWLDDVVLRKLSAGRRPPVARRIVSRDSVLALGADGAVVSLRHAPSGVDVVGGVGAAQAHRQPPGGIGLLPVILTLRRRRYSNAESAIVWR